MTHQRIIFDRVWKKFHRGQLHDSLRDLIPAVARRLMGKAPDDATLEDGDFWALRDLSFEVRPGQTLGIIGPNGSGKSTTLKMLTRILQPTKGYCEVHGRLGALIEVSAGFHGDLTGRENVFLQGAIMGMRSADIARKFDEIVEFSGVADAIDTPVKRYSSGMNARLGFSIAAHLEPDVLIIDEVLAVGDMAFQERAFGRISALARSGIPVVMVSHQLERIAELCTDAILLHKGEVAFRGTPSDTIAAYVKQHQRLLAVADTGVVALDSIEVLGGDEVKSGATLTLRVTGRILETLGEHVEPVQVKVRTMRTGGLVYSSGSRRLGVNLGKPGPFCVTLELQANLPVGSYVVEVAPYDSARQNDVGHTQAVMIRVTDAGSFVGSVQLNARMAVQR